MNKADLALARYYAYVSDGMDKVDAVCRAIDSVSSTWYEYARIYNDIKEEL